jgi:hypothetical protein
LGITPHHARQLCKFNLVEAELSAGGQWRVPLAEIERLERDGIPAAPTLMQESEPSEVARPSPSPGLYREASDELAAAAESVEIVERRVQRRKLELLDAQLDDEFEERARRKAAEDTENRRLLVEARAQQEQDQWLQGKAAYALSGVRQDAPLELKRAACDAALKFLQDTDRRIVPDEMVNALLKDSVQTVVRIYDQQQSEIKRQAQEARQRTLLESVNALVGIVSSSQAREAKQLEAFFAIAHPPRLAPAPQFATLRPESDDAEAERQAAADRADQLLKHVGTYLKKYKFSGGWPEQSKEGDRLRIVIRQPLIDALLKDPTMSNGDGRDFVEREVDGRIS